MENKRPPKRTAQQNKNLAEWILDLETTKARQIKGRLCDASGGFCCLGRAMKLHGGIPVKRTTDDAAMVFEGLIFFDLPDEDWFDSKFGIGLHSSQFWSNMNDTLDLSFVEIARILRKHLPMKYRKFKKLSEVVD